MKPWLLSFFLLLFGRNALASHDHDSIFASLDKAIADKPIYDNKKKQRIADIRKNIGYLEEYYFNKAMYDEYRKFRLDSAIFYIKRNLAIAKRKNNKEFQEAAQIQLANLYSSSGMYLESEALLQSLDRKKLTPELLPDYFEAYSQFYEHYASHSYEISYLVPIEKYRDSLLSVLEPNTLKFRINSAQRDIYLKQYASAQKNLTELLAEADSDSQTYAMVSYLLGDIAMLNGDSDRSLDFYALSAIADIKSATKDNASLQTLATIFYRKGDLDKANRFTKSAIEDAIFCNAKFRTIQITSFYTMINKTYQEKEAKRSGQLKTYLISISVLSLLLFIAVAYVYLQMKKVSRIRRKLSISSEKLSELNIGISQTNAELQETNSRLHEANHVKEEYIAHFFDMCSSYINKLESYRKTLNKKAHSKQLDELFTMLKSTTLVESELEELYHNFDTIFLNLYPTFVDDFNTLLVDDEHVQLKPGELLNTELRVFALIRLGITDSVKIAAFLRYSLSTIYNYRTRARNKAIGSRDGFEELVMKIGNSTTRA
ncbi:MAG: hypothetical protein EOO50_01480 [Flavobacterium sp.]|uniref:DUF6377 domain-containing protein n=1 Tax=Flavobacterium sp. TaxID=239 RepID=UPI0012170DE1|nr:DUF6377 domain-containing protein [Flavobacterium sp.]RZJ68490.1 MAG: hypothetical protein EOO50_01480 [Flavobacterium sp.]